MQIISSQLYCLAEHCGYGQLYSEIIWDRLVIGLRDKKTDRTTSDGSRTHFREDCHTYTTK